MSSGTETSTPLVNCIVNYRNKSITSKAMQYRQDIVTRIPIMRVELILSPRPIVAEMTSQIRPIQNVC